jgi:ABC-2 type transport system ATP-binding protein
MQAEEPRQRTGCSVAGTVSIEVGFLPGCHLSRIGPLETQTLSVPILQVRDVVKRYATVTAVNGVSLTVRAGERFALLGPNGAGKSSLIRMVLGLTRPDAGGISLHFDGAITPPGHANAARIGYLPEERGLYQDVPLLRTLTYFATLRGMTSRAGEAAAREWLERLHLADRAREPVKALSKGNQQKVQLASALLHRPALAILDEPFSGLDPLNQEYFLGLIRDLAAEGTTVLFSAHQMQLVERLADRIAIMQAGRIVLEGTPAQLAAAWHAGDVLVMQVAPGDDPAPLARHAAVAAVHREGEEVRLTLRRGVPVGDLLADAARTCTIRAVRTERASLHDIYVQTLGGNPAAAGPEAA